MKKLFLILMLAGAGSAQARQIVLDIPDNDLAIVEHDVIDAETWIKAAWDGKLNASKKRIKKETIDDVVKNGGSLPAGDNAIIQQFMSKPDYKSRKDMEIKGK